MNKCEFFIDGKCNDLEAQKTCSDPCEYNYYELELVKKLSNGLCLWKKKNEVGGFTYIGESCGIEAILWDDCIGIEEEFLAIAEDCYGLILMGRTADDGDFEEISLEDIDEEKK
jgi:hypothetical protein